MGITLPTLTVASLNISSTCKVKPSVYSQRYAIVVTDRQTDSQKDTQTNKPSTVTLAAHARRGL